MTKGSTLAAIKASLQQWATAHVIDVDSRGRVRNLRDNLFAPLNPQTLREFESGDGDELGTADDVGKLHSLWSSAALVCNVFDYWRERPSTPLLKALRVRHFASASQPTSPHVSSRSVEPESGTPKLTSTS